MNGERYARLLVTTVILLSLAAGLIHAQGPESTLFPQAALGTMFTYQGQLVKEDTPVNASCDLRFTLYDDESGGTQIGPTEEKSGIAVSDGLFTTRLDFGEGAFNGEVRWLEIEVRCPPDGDYTMLSPRQLLTPAPYALALPGLWTQQHDISPNLVGGYARNWVTDGVWGATIGGGGEDWARNRVTDNLGTVAGGTDNQAGNDSGTLVDAELATVGGGARNTASGSYSTVSGGIGNTAAFTNTTVSGGAVSYTHLTLPTKA